MSRVSELESQSASRLEQNLQKVFRKNLKPEPRAQNYTVSHSSFMGLTPADANVCPSRRSDAAHYEDGGSAKMYQHEKGCTVDLCLWWNQRRSLVCPPTPETKNNFLLIFVSLLQKYEGAQYTNFMFALRPWDCSPFGSCRAAFSPILDGSSAKCASSAL